MDWLRPLLGMTVRTLMGLLIGGTFGFLGVGIGWGSFVFFGARSGDTLLLFFIGGASVGAAGGVFLAWLNLDGNSALRLIVMGSLLLLAAAAGSWGGYQFGSVQDVPCCASPDVTPITYIVVGAIVATSVVALIVNLSHRALPIFRR
ncbi:MAG: hypothetical protein IID00_02285 [Chloroflexi bacterium]|nr:hypothetical protein [Chloroflexota bacterium]